MKLHYSEVSKTILDVKVDKRTEVFNWGKDNAFPSMIEALINISVTSKTCIDRVAKAIYGDGFGKIGNVIVNSKGQTLNELLRIVSREYAKQNNIFLHIRYDGNYDFKSIVLVPSTHVRLGKDDDRGYSGKFLIYDNWDKSKGGKIMSDNFILVDRFNTAKGVVEGQVENAGGLSDYNGQIIHIQKSNGYVYSLSDLNPVMSEALLEGNSQLFRSRGSQKGFLNTKLLAVQPFGSEDDRNEFKKDLNDVRGAENSSEVVILESAQVSDDVTKQMYLGDLSSPYNDKLFEYSDTMAEKNISKAFSVPLILIDTTDSASFGDSGGKLKEAKLQLFESREEDRNQIEEVFQMIMKKFSDPVEGLAIINPFEEQTEEAGNETPEDVNKQAQATLRGSVGGVTALLAIQQSVAAKTTTKEAGIAMIVNIYGFDEDTASKMLGNPEEGTNQNNI